MYDFDMRCRIGKYVTQSFAAVLNGMFATCSKLQSFLIERPIGRFCKGRDLFLFGR